MWGGFPDGDKITLTRMILAKIRTIKEWNLEGIGTMVRGDGDVLGR